LQECQAYLSSPDAQAYIQQTAAEGANINNNNTINTNTNTTPNTTAPPEATRAMLNGTHPNPNLQIHRRGPNNKRSRDSAQGMVSPATPRPAPSQPSLTAHLLSTNSTIFGAATQQAFLSHAGCGTLSASALAQWMVQDGHYTRGYIQFIGALIAKIRLPSVPNSQFNPMFRTLDLLISALNNIRREMSFFDITATKYAIQLNSDPPNFVTRAYLDLFVAVSSPGASLLEGMVVLWATEHVRISLGSGWTDALIPDVLTVVSICLDVCSIF
jgi:thiaminase